MSNPIPSYNNQVVGQALARLSGAFITQPTIRAWLMVVMQPWQDLEDATWGVLTLRFLATAAVLTLPATNSVFDSIGALVGVTRAGTILSDLVMKALIYLRIAVNRCKGQIVDWSRFAQILAPYVGGPVMYLDGQAGVYFGLWNLQLPPNAVGQELARAPGNGIYGELAYSTWPDGEDFGFTSVYDASAGQAGYGSVYTTGVGGLQVAGIELTPLQAEAA